MKNRELIEYLQRFGPETDVCCLVADIKGRMRFLVGGVAMITDSKGPIFCLEIEGQEPFDQEEIEAAEECEAMEGGE